ncbi:MAG: hypothetical protein WDM77_14730 [Steroidobacteraceae bacterium]
MCRDFTTALNDFIALLIMWCGPFGGVWIADAYVRRGQYDALAIHGRGPVSIPLLGAGTVSAAPDAWPLAVGMLAAD